MIHKVPSAQVEAELPVRWGLLVDAERHHHVVAAVVGFWCCKGTCSNGISGCSFSRRIKSPEAKASRIVVTVKWFMNCGRYWHCEWMTANVFLTKKFFSLYPHISLAQCFLSTNQKAKQSRDLAVFTWWDQHILCCTYFHWYFLQLYATWILALCSLLIGQEKPIDWWNDREKLNSHENVQDGIPQLTQNWHDISKNIFLSKMKFQAYLVVELLVVWMYLILQ